MAMAYDTALNKAWEELTQLKLKENVPVKFLADEYSVDLENRKVLSLSCNVPAKDFTVILILHYLIKRLNGLPDLTGEWLDFKELSGIEGYNSAFRKRVIEPIIRKYAANPEGLLAILDRFPSKRVDQADIGIVIEVFEQVAAMVLFWRPDEEFGAEANLLFDKSIAQIFCTEDIVVLAESIARQL